MHRLLQRQLKRHTESVDSIPEEWQSFIDAVNKTYHQTDADRALLERSLDLTSQELIEGNRQLRRQIAELERYAMQLKTATDISSAATSILDLDELLPHVVELVRERFGLYYAGIFLLDEQREWAVLRAGTGEAGRKMLEAGHRLKMGSESMIGWCTAHDQARIALDVGDEAVRFDNPLLPKTHSEMALPLSARGRVIGAMTIQSTEEAAFSDQDIAALQTMADQVASAIENARLFERTQEALGQTEALYKGSSQVTGAQTIDDILQALIQSTALQRLERANFLLFDRPFMHSEQPDAFTVKAVWERSGGEPRAPVGTRYDFDQFPAARVVDRHEPTIVENVATDKRIDEKTRDLILNQLGTRSIVFWPLMVGEQWIGLVTGQAPRVLEMNEDEVRQITNLVDQAATAIQNQLLLEQTQARVRRERILREITTRMRGFTDPEAIIRSAVRELGIAIGRPTFVRLGSQEDLSQPLEKVNGGDGKEGEA